MKYLNELVKVYNPPSRSSAEWASGTVMEQTSDFMCCTFWSFFPLHTSLCLFTWHLSRSPLCWCTAAWFWPITELRPALTSGGQLSPNSQRSCPGFCYLFSVFTARLRLIQAEEWELFLKHYNPKGCLFWEFNALRSWSGHSHKLTSCVGIYRGIVSIRRGVRIQGLPPSRQQTAGTEQNSSNEAASKAWDGSENDADRNQDTQGGGNCSCFYRNGRGNYKRVWKHSSKYVSLVHGPKSGSRIQKSNNQRGISLKVLELASSS